jgi:hypothetical protein
VRGSIGEVGGQLVEGPPKSAAGRRDVAIPEAIVPEMVAHLDEWSQDGADGRVFVGPKGATPRRGNFQVTWSRAVARAGVPGLLPRPAAHRQHAGRPRERAFGS